MAAVKLTHHPNTVPLLVKGQRVALADYITSTCPTIVGPKATFTPTSYLFNGHLQTGYAAYYNSSTTDNDIVYQRQMLDLPDGGHLALDWTPPNQPLDNTPVLVALHGLTGGSHESYIRSVLEVVTRPPFNYRAVVMNCRGCANTSLKTPQLFNGAYTDDLRFVLKHLQEVLPAGTPLVGIGFSLGANILVKYLGEEQEKTPFKAAISVANPFDFMKSSQSLDENYFSRSVYSATMANNLKRAFSKHTDILGQDGKINVEEVMNSSTLRGFDDACTRKMFNYTTVNNYYRDASSCRFIEKVRIPLLCFNALDDPIVPESCIPYDEVKVNPYVVLATTEKGGHLGWFEHLRQPTRWIVKPLAEFIVAMFKIHDIRESPTEMEPDTIAQNVDTIQAAE
ncbi:Alpha/Beta hydrolase protein [Radiomyces spectabilis]|uniref:Alpha/Beta hydrolase protein n=1 Tax=Radiomyces spectabilis TaxID=64574 RepID=UPI00221F5C31|nr:Alpha/Beta hydrolase protein [Radiomyces spectabilis]KAI8384369.1 Alpha/Beta hydrolase protein [Radiomyces spectabilis]